MLRRGRLSPREKALRDALAQAVFRLASDFSASDVANALGKERHAIGRLIVHGRKLAAEAEHRAAEQSAAGREARLTPCRRHAAFHPDCPSCLRNAPEEAVTNRWPAFEGRIAGGAAR